MSEGRKTIIITQEVWKDAAGEFRTAVTEVHGTTYGHMVVETSKALMEYAKKLRGDREG